MVCYSVANNLRLSQKARIPTDKICLVVIIHNPELTDNFISVKDDHLSHPNYCGCGITEDWNCSRCGS